MDNKIFIATPSYNNTFDLNYLLSVTNILKSGIDCDIHTNEGAIIHAQRNELISKFYLLRDEYTHILWHDADVCVEEHGLATLLGHGVDVIGAPIPMKEGSGTVNASVKNVITEVKPFLYTAEGMATGFLLVSRQAVIDIIESTKLFHVRKHDQHKVYDVFNFAIDSETNEFIGEDMLFCFKLRELGYDIHVDSSFDVYHAGRYNWHRPKSEHKKIKEILHYG